MNTAELHTKIALLSLLVQHYSVAGDTSMVMSLKSIMADLALFTDMPQITFEGDSKTAECGDGTEDIFRINDHSECVRIVCCMDDTTASRAGMQFSKWLQKIENHGLRPATAVRTIRAG